MMQAQEEAIYNTINAGIEKLRELNHPGYKPGNVCIMVENDYAVRIALATHGEYIDKHGVIRVRLIEKIRRFIKALNK
jgi:hypothetical protein